MRARLDFDKVDLAGGSTQRIVELIVAAKPVLRNDLGVVGPEQDRVPSKALLQFVLVASLVV